MRIRDFAVLVCAGALWTAPLVAEGLSGGIGGGTAGAYSGHETGDLGRGVGRFQDPPRGSAGWGRRIDQPRVVRRKRIAPYVRGEARIEGAATRPV